jgi:hypothetical protein
MWCYTRGKVKIDDNTCVDAAIIIEQSMIVGTQAIADTQRRRFYAS